MTDNRINLKNVIKEEYKKCSQNPVYFMKNYCYIATQTQGVIKFNMFDYQVDAIEQIQNNRWNIVLKGRQIGISTAISCYAVWLTLFHPGKNVLIVATKKEIAQEIITKCKVAIEGLPSWLKLKTPMYNTTTIKFSSGSAIKAVAATKDAGRSFAASLLIVDEAAHIEYARDIWTAASPTLTTSNGSCVLISTPNGMGNFFYDTWEESERGINDFNKIKLDWTVDPRRDAKWAENELKAIGPIRFRQEYGAEFIGSGNTVIDEDLIQHYINLYKQEPKYKSGIDNNLWVWEEPIYGHGKYMVVGDVARGDGNDSSAFHVIDLDRCVQVAEYEGKVDTDLFSHMLITTGTNYNDALIVIENAQQGYAVLQNLIKRQYKNLFYMTEDMKYVDEEDNVRNKMNAEEKKAVPGFTTSLKTRPLIISKLEEFMRANAPIPGMASNPNINNGVVIRSLRTLSQLRTFVWHNGKAQATSGKNDDLVMALAIGLWIRETALKIYQNRLELTKKTLQGFNKTSYDSIYKNTPIHQEDPYKMPSGFDGHIIDLRWLL